MAGKAPGDGLHGGDWLGGRDRTRDRRRVGGGERADAGARHRQRSSRSGASWKDGRVRWMAANLGTASGVEAFAREVPDTDVRLSCSCGNLPRRRRRPRRQRRKRWMAARRTDRSVPSGAVGMNR